MIEIELKVHKASVYDEVAKTTSYTGSKMIGDEGAYERIFTTDEDQLMLERFWVEASNVATERLKPFLRNVSSQEDANGYSVVLEVSSAFDINLKDSIESELMSYFVASIVGKWYTVTNKGEAESYERASQGMLDDVMRQLYYRKKPKRVVPV